MIIKKLKLLFIFLLPLATNAQIITRFAGGGTVLLGDGGPATAANIPDPGTGIFDKNGNYYNTSSSGHRIRKVDTSGIVTTIAGTGTGGYNGDNISATAAKLYEPAGITLDSNGNLYICDERNERIRRVDKITGIITTVAGTGTGGYNGDGIPATNAQIYDPQGVCFDKFGNLYVTEYLNNRIRKVTPTGIISTFAGTGVAGYSGEGGLADTSKVNLPGGICADTAGNIYYADISNSRVFRINIAGIITTYAGTSTGYLYNGDDIPATIANIDPYFLTIDDTGNLFIAEYHNYRVRKVDAAGIIHTVAGNGISGTTGEGGPATAAEFQKPNGVALDACGNLYIPDANSGHVRKVIFNPGCDPYLHTHFDSATLSVPVVAVGDVSIYPNPAFCELTVATSTSLSGGQEMLRSITISNVMGQAMLYRACNGAKETINIAALPVGVYMVRVTNDKGVQTVRKIVKQ